MSPILAGDSLLRSHPENPWRPLQDLKSDSCWGRRAACLKFSLGESSGPWSHHLSLRPEDSLVADLQEGAREKPRHRNRWTESFGAEHFPFRKEGRGDVKAEQRRQEGKGETVGGDTGMPFS